MLPRTGSNRSVVLKRRRRLVADIAAGLGCLARRYRHACAGRFHIDRAARLDVGVLGDCPLGDDGHILCCRLNRRVLRNSIAVAVCGDEYIARRGSDAVARDRDRAIDGLDLGVLGSLNLAHRHAVRLVEVDGSGRRFSRDSPGLDVKRLGRGTDVILGGEVERFGLDMGRVRASRKRICGNICGVTDCGVIVLDVTLVSRERRRLLCVNGAVHDDVARRGVRVRGSRQRDVVVVGLDGCAIVDSNRPVNRFDEDAARIRRAGRGDVAESDRVLVLQRHRRAVCRHGPGKVVLFVVRGDRLADAILLRCEVGVAGKDAARKVDCASFGGDSQFPVGAGRDERPVLARDSRLACYRDSFIGCGLGGSIHGDSPGCLGSQCLGSHQLRVGNRDVPRRFVATDCHSVFARDDCAVFDFDIAASVKSHRPDGGKPRGCAVDSDVFGDGVNVQRVGRADSGSVFNRHRLCRVEREVRAGVADMGACRVRAVIHQSGHDR